MRDAPPDGMILVPAGPFLMGSDEFARETPPHVVDLPAFWIDRFPVTNAEFETFVAATGHRAPVDWIDGAPRPGFGRHPVMVTWIGRGRLLALGRQAASHRGRVGEGRARH